MNITVTMLNFPHGLRRSLSWVSKAWTVTSVFAKRVEPEVRAVKPRHDHRRFGDHEKRASSILTALYPAGWTILAIWRSVHAKMEYAQYMLLHRKVDAMRNRYNSGSSGTILAYRRQQDYMADHNRGLFVSHRRHKL